MADAPALAQGGNPPQDGAAPATLFTPLRFAGLHLKNRLVMAPMGSCQSDANGFVTDQTVEYYRRRATGGVGMITVEAALVDPETHGHEPRLHSPEYVPGMRKIVEAVRAHGVTVGIQLMHPGRQVTSGPTSAPSPIALNSKSPVPRELSVDEIAGIVAQYAAAARLAETAGFDFVEVHGAHGYLPSDFLSPNVNARDDAYGGDLRRRSRFVLEVARAIIAVTGIPLFWRLGGEELTEAGYAIEDQVQVARWLEEAGVACLSVSAGTWHTLEMTVAPMYVPRGALVRYAARVRESVGVPVIAVGRLDDPQLAQRVVGDGSADLVMLGRGLLADPDWPRKLQGGNAEEIRPCIACNACVDLVAKGEAMRCAVNAETGREAEWELLPAPEPRRIMVLGGGPAGMETARVAALRGHSVSIWERDGELGGKLDVASRAPSKHEVLRYRDYQIHVLAGQGIDIHLGTEIAPGDVAREDPDVVVLAIGAEPLIPPISGVDLSHVVDAQGLLNGQVPVAPHQRVVVVGGSATGCEAAELLLERGIDVTIVEMRGSIGHGIEQITRRNLVGRFRREGMKVLTRATVTRIDADQVAYQEKDGSTRTLPADIVALAVGWRPRGPQLAEMVSGREVVIVGDALLPADFVAATGAAAEAALRL